jgi:hypothetical protein
MQTNWRLRMFARMELRNRFHLTERPQTSLAHVSRGPTEVARTGAQMAPEHPTKVALIEKAGVERNPVMPRAHRHITITVGDRVLTGVLEQDRAPATCEAFLTVLPLCTQLMQARWSGEAAWVPLGQLNLGVGSENQLHRPRPGQVLFHAAAESETEILLPYGVTAFAAVCGPLYGNHFLTINEQEEELREIGRRVLLDGAQDVEFALKCPR